MLDHAAIKQAATEVGFDACGIARAEPLTDDEYPLREWLGRGWHAGLSYMERNVDKRMNPRLLLPGAQSIICVVRGYNPSQVLTTYPKVARYAYAEDYHEVIKNMLHELKARLGIDGKVCCDTVPISDKHWAARAGLGWIGRHTLLVTPDWGSWINIGEIVTTEACDQYDTPIASPCHDCGLCVKACPNHALSPDGPPMLNLHLCTAYHTIESHADTIPDSIDTHGYAFGCDLCQQACPYNADTRVKQRPIDTARLTSLEHLPTASEEEFRHAIQHTSMSRIGYQQWKRNLTTNKNKPQ